ncbi:hypothetical protein EXU57_24190 [Segetibacter sp. 3557_3]|uniref:hypothetical protein n=1 Tax=Segetibacter sp. 3557_3 TaxID=2547429 RepID=UPI001058FE9A|nr:hypothetical protein [Segetibacter sp. 3557_3]TDH18154.1 hypothetical protein EXU57_24190 [Segetibacter sp. 3557_3]
MKKTLCMLMMCSIGFSVFAQTPEEWINQKATQRKYLLKQIASLQVYLDHLNAGYRIASQGIGAINKFKKGDLDVHGSHFQALKKVNAKVKNYGRVADIIQLQSRILTLYREVQQILKSSGAVSATEKHYLNSVYGNILSGTANNINSLFEITSNGVVAMNDAERINRIEALYTDMFDKLQFASSFKNQLINLLAQRGKEQRNVNAVRLLNGLNQ